MLTHSLSSDIKHGFDEGRLISTIRRNPELNDKLPIVRFTNFWLEQKHNELVGELVRTASELAKQEGIAEAGYRTGFNCNDAGGQTIYHIHLHLMGGRTFGWPPG